MQLTRNIYEWLVNTQIIPNAGELTTQNQVQIPNQIAHSFHNGYLIAKIVEQLVEKTANSSAKTLLAVKNDGSGGVKSTNWNLIWLSFESINLKFDSRIKQLILQGEHALINEILKQLYERQSPRNDQPLVIRSRERPKKEGGMDLKAMDLSKNAEQSSSPLEFLVLLLKKALNMSLENILSLFTDQNKYLAHVIVKGINDNFDPIILFYSLLLKHTPKLKSLLAASSTDAAACLYAIKPGFISKSQAVAELTVQLFFKFQRLYGWFISAESKCINTFLLGYSRHLSLRSHYWNLLCHLIKDNIAQFFGQSYNKFTQRSEELLSITTLIIKPLAQANWKQTIIESEAITKWISMAAQLPQKDIDSQIIAFNFIAQLMLYFPRVIQQNEWSLQIVTKKWQSRPLIPFVTLFNQLITILQRLGAEKSPMARRIYMEIALIIRSLPKGEKRDYVLHNFALTVTKFPTIPSQNVIQHIQSDFVSSCQFLLICESIQTTQNTVTLYEIGRVVRQLFCQDPLLNFYAVTVLKEIIDKLRDKDEKIGDFVRVMFQEALQRFALVQKYKSIKLSQGGLCFGSSQSSKKMTKEDQTVYRIKLAQKQLLLRLVRYCVDLAAKGDDKELAKTVANLLIKANSNIKQHNNKVGSKELQSLLSSRFQISDQYIKQLDQSQLKLSVTSNSSPKPAPSKQLTSQQMRFKNQQQHFQSEKHYADLQKLKSNLELQLSNIYYNSHTDSVLAEDGFLELFVHPHERMDLVLKAEMETRDLQVIQTILGKYRKILQMLFDNYSGVAYSAQNSGLIDESIKRKQFLTSVELTKFLKDYKKFYLTSQQEVNSMVKEINMRLADKKSLHELDFNGFQQYIVQYCLKNLTIPHQITTTTTTAKSYASKPAKSEIEKKMKTLEGQPIQVLLQQFFKELKESFVSRKESLALFEDFEDIVLTKDQAEETQAYNSKLLRNPHYILPKGYKKITESTITYSYLLSPSISKISQAYQTAISVLDDIIYESSLGLHIIESIAQKKTISRARPITYAIKGQQKLKQRAMSTTFEKNNSSFLEKSTVLMLSTNMRSALKKISIEDRSVGQEAALLLQSMLVRVSAKPSQKAKIQKLQPPKRKSVSTAQILQIQQKNLLLKQKKSKEKQQVAQEAKRVKKEEQAKRRENIEKFLQNQKQKLLEKRKLQQDKKQLEEQQQRQKQLLKRQNLEKFKFFHEEQYKKIKKIQETALERIRKEENEKMQKKERQDKSRLIRSEKIKQETKLIMEIKKQVQKKLATLFLSQQIKDVFKKHEPNLKALFDFLLNLTHKSLTQKNHNNEIVFQTWRYFASAFELCPLFMTPQDIISIFKNFTKNKLVAKEFMAGLTFKQFQEALFRIAVKGKGYFNHICQKIKEPLGASAKVEEQSAGKSQEKDVNQFDSNEQTDLAQIQKQNGEGKTQIDQFGDLSKVNSGTLKGLIYYLKVPDFKQGQQERFRAILNKKTEYAPTQNRIKQKLSQFYDLSRSKNSSLTQRKSRLKSLLASKQKIEQQ